MVSQFELSPLAYQRINKGFDILARNSNIFDAARELKIKRSNDLHWALTDKDTHPSFAELAPNQLLELLDALNSIALITMDLDVIENEIDERSAEKDSLHKEIAAHKVEVESAKMWEDVAKEENKAIGEFKKAIDELEKHHKLLDLAHVQEISTARELARKILGSKPDSAFNEYCNPQILTALAVLARTTNRLAEVPYTRKLQEDSSYDDREITLRKSEEVVIMDTDRDEATDAETVKEEKVTQPTSKVARKKVSSIKTEPVKTNLIAAKPKLTFVSNEAPSISTLELANTGLGFVGINEVRRYDGHDDLIVTLDLSSLGNSTEGYRLSSQLRLVTEPAGAINILSQMRTISEKKSNVALPWSVDRTRNRCELVVSATNVETGERIEQVIPGEAVTKSSRPLVDYRSTLQEKEVQAV